MTANHPENVPPPPGFAAEDIPPLDHKLELAVRKFLEERFKAIGFYNLIAVGSFLVVVAGYVFYQTRVGVETYINKHAGAVNDLSRQSGVLATTVGTLQRETGLIQQKLKETNITPLASS